MGGGHVLDGEGGCANGLHARQTAHHLGHQKKTIRLVSISRTARRFWRDSSATWRWSAVKVSNGSWSSLIHPSIPRRQIVVPMPWHHYRQAVQLDPGVKGEVAFFLHGNDRVRQSSLLAGPALSIFV